MTPATLVRQKHVTFVGKCMQEVVNIVKQVCSLKVFQKAKFYCIDREVSAFLQKPFLEQIVTLTRTSVHGSKVKRTNSTGTELTV